MILAPGRRSRGVSHCILIALLFTALGLHPPASSYQAGSASIGRGIDLLAFASQLLALGLAARNMKRRGGNPAGFTMVAFGALGVLLLTLDNWTHVYDCGRLMSPSFALLSIEAIAEGQSLLLLLRCWLR